MGLAKRKKDRLPSVSRSKLAIARCACRFLKKKKEEKKRNKKSMKCVYNFISKIAFLVSSKKNKARNFVEQKLEIRKHILANTTTL